MILVTLGMILGAIVFLALQNIVDQNEEDPNHLVDLLSLVHVTLVNRLILAHLLADQHLPLADLAPRLVLHPLATF
jgi:hypothetical protein